MQPSPMRLYNKGESYGMGRIIAAIFVIGIYATMLSGCLGSNNPAGDDAASSAIIEEVIYDESGIKISTVGFDNGGFWGPEIKLLVENTTEKNIILAGYDYIVNGTTLEGAAYIEVASSKKTNGAISLLDSELKLANISEIATISAIDFSVYDADSMGLIRKISFEIRTSIADTYAQPLPSHEDIIFQRDGITVSAYGASDSLMHKSVVLMVTNGYGRDIVISSDNESVNDFTISAGMSDVVYKGTTRFCGIDFSKKQLEENDIFNIEAVDFTIKIVDISSGNCIAETEELHICLPS